MTPMRGKHRLNGACVWCGIILAVGFSLLGRASAQSEGTRELCRIRIVNRVGGPVEVSTDGGRTYARVGKVTHPATTSTRGYAASVYAPLGTVAATAVHGIRIKTAGARECSREESRVISILPAEFAVVPKGFGGHAAGSSGICTDIPTGEAIFRNLAPFVGNPVFQEIHGRLVPLADGYTPGLGDVLVIVVSVPARYPKELVLENSAGGSVEAVYSDAREIIARVERPVRGVGRFDATGYTGVGRINTNHTGVITISTAPISSAGKDGAPIETRGGFMIQPSRHAMLSTEAFQILVVAPLSKDAPQLEGRPPLFSNYIGLAHDPADERNSFRVDVRTAQTDWMPLPPIVGKHDDALMKLPNGAGAVTHIRIRFPELSPEWVQAETLRCARAYLEVCQEKALKRGTVITSGNLTLELDTAGLRGVQFVNLYVDGEFRGARNTGPYTFTLDTRTLSSGEHIAELRALDAQGTTLKRVAREFFVQSSEPRTDEASGRR